jgi:hypothetical protein
MMTSHPSLPPLPSNRKFGALFALVFTGAAAYLYFEASSAWPIATLLALLFAAAALIAPTLLAPLNRLWFRFGLLLGRVVSPLVLGLIFFAIITPVSLIARLAGRDALLMKKRKVASYWVARDPPGPEPGSLRNQF